MKGLSSALAVAGVRVCRIRIKIKLGLVSKVDLKSKLCVEAGLSALPHRWDNFVFLRAVFCYASRKISQVPRTLSPSVAAGSQLGDLQLPEEEEEDDSKADIVSWGGKEIYFLL